MTRLVAALISLAFVVLGCAVPSQKHNFSNTQNSEPRIALLSLRPERSSESYIRLYGELRNISSEPLRSIWVIATFRDSTGQLVRSDDFVIEQNPINPGQTAPFMTISKFNDDVSSYEVSFKTTGGQAVDHVDQRPVVSAKKKKKKVF